MALTPLVGVQRSTQVEIHRRQDELDLNPILQVTITGRIWGGDDEYYDANADGITDFPLRANMRYDRERRRRPIPGVQVVNSHIDADQGGYDRLDEETPGRRVWAGIGGFLYIPSFPQLRRKETLWPDAT